MLRLSCALFLVVACECTPEGPMRPRMTDAGPTVLPDAAPLCAVPETICGTACCAEGDVCAADNACCDPATLCGTSCCTEAGDVCEGAVCHLGCGAATRCRDASGEEVCCADAEVCTSDRCFMPTIPCIDFWECPEGTYCESALGYCLPDPTGEPCQTRPTGGAVVPTELWHWDGSGAALPAYNQVMMTPAVANLTDDNGDGRVDTNDVPDVVFSTFCGVSGMGCTVGEYHRDGVLRAVSGADGSSIFDVTTHRVIGGAQVALGDIDGDGLVEIVACGSNETREGPILVFEHDGTFKWQSTDPRVRCGQSAPFIADLDADGEPEIGIRYTMLSARDGSVRWHHECTNTGTFTTASGVVTYEHFPCDYTTAADLDGDRDLEVVGGNMADDSTGALLWDRSAEYRDGYPAIGDLDRDGDAEIVVVSSAFDPEYAMGDHHIRVLDAMGNVIAGPVDINAPSVNRTTAYLTHLMTMDVAGGGPPTIANFDADREPEIALAGAYGYVVFEGDLTLKWFAPTHDHSSRKTGSSVFDFDGDGVAEAVYNDEYWLRVYDGRDGTVRYCECNTSITHWEYPVIADVDNDAHAEIVVASNDYYIRSCPASEAPDDCTRARVAAGETNGTHGVRVFASPTRDWVATRRIWNQHTYHITNVTETGIIPRGEPQNWSYDALDNFRQNVQPGARNIPDLVPFEMAVDLSGCGARLTLYFRVKNQGWAAAPAGVPVTVYVQEPDGSFRRLGRVTTTRRLLPGEDELLSWEFPLDGRDPTAPVNFRVVINDPGDGPLPGLTECRPMNNAAEVTASCDLVI